MKSFVIAMCVASVIACNSETNIEQYVEQNQLIDSVICLIADDQALICATTKPIFSLSQRQSLVEQIVQGVYDNYGLKATVCFDCDVYYRASKLKSEPGVDKQQVHALIQTCKSRRSYEYNRDNREQKGGQTA
ncbi:MAG: hypothetical protein ACI4MI_00715 [Christensenellales bacterium]